MCAGWRREIEERLPGDVVRWIEARPDSHFCPVF
jgi:hypothetical protein